MNTYWQRLWHRWLVEYNPLYLASATLVLGGTFTLSRGLAYEGSVYGVLGVAAIAELYACALIGASAFLMRIGLRRPAVLLALITALYQGDLTLHTDACAWLGWAGALGALVWLLLFVVKLRALAWALRLRLSRSAVVVPTFGALGLAVLPRVFFARVDPALASSLVALWVFGLFAGALWTHRAVTSRVDLDDWGQTVLRRGLRAVWLLWGLLALLHALFWASEGSISGSVFVPVAILLGTRFVRSEASVWATACAALVLVGASAPELLSLTALLSTAVLVLRALRKPELEELVPATLYVNAPYRVPEPNAAPPAPPRPVLTFVRAGAPALGRLLTGALFSTYLAAWTFGWRGGPWPAHSVALDVALTVAVVLVMAKLRVRAAAAPLAATYVHLGVELGVIYAPATLLGWGAGSIALGFALLAIAIGTSWYLQRRGSPAADTT